MDDLKRIQEDILGESYSSDGELTSQMREKIRSQAQRLRILEQYRLLCEQRIQELCPSHPFPVKPEHLGSNLNPFIDLTQAKKKISRLESQIIGNQEKFNSKDENLEILEKYEKVIQEKIEVEESLRAEMLSSEQQRAYIEILKQALEEIKGSKVTVKVEGSKNVSSRKFEDFEPAGKESLENRQEKDKNSKRWQHLIEVKEKDIKNLEVEKKELENEIIQLEGDKKTLENHLKQAAEALQTADDEIARLEEEKTNLLEYVDEHSQKEAEMEKELAELSKYFESMKNEFEKSKIKFEQELKNKDFLLAKNENCSEELYQEGQKTKDLQESLKNFKILAEEKDNFIKRLKEEKLAMEIKIENLQANATTLAETLKETQFELEECERITQDMKKSEVHKQDVISKQKIENNLLSLQVKTLQEELEDSKRHLESLQQDSKHIERNQEEDQKQLQELKLAFSKMKAKCQHLEEERLQKLELEQLRQLDEEKWSQLQEDYSEVQQAYNECQQRELIQTEALNDLRKHNSELSREVEELYKENQKLSIEFSLKSQNFEEILEKFSKCEKALKSLENDKKTLEIQVKAEKNQARNFKEQGISAKEKFDELNKKWSIEQETLERNNQKIRALEEELSSLKLKVKTKDRETEEEKHKRSRVSEDLIILQEKYGNNERELEKLKLEMFECYKLVASFAGKSTVYSSEGKTFISPGYKEFLLLWKDKISSNSSILSSWISNTIDEIETLSKKLHDLQKELSQSSSDLLKLTCKLEDFNSEDFCSKQEQIRLRGQLESLMQKNESLQEVKNKEINSLKLEIQENQKELGFTFVENSKLKDQVNKLSNELMELKTASQVFRSTLKSSEEKMNLLKNEKNQLENYVKQVQITIGSNEVNKIQAEISRIQAELEVLERERLNFECQLLKVQTDPRMRDLNSVKDLNYKLTHTERLINNYKKTLGILLEDLQKEEMIQSLRSSQHENKNTEKRLVFPKSISVLTSRFSESTKNLRKKSPFE